MKITLKVFRYNPEKDKKPHFDKFELERLLRAKDLLPDRGARPAVASTTIGRPTGASCGHWASRAASGAVRCRCPSLRCSAS